MRKLIVAEHISLDGVIQGPGGPEEDPSDGFRFGGWTVPYADQAIGQEVIDMLAQPFELLLGRRTYDIWAAYWPHVPTGNFIGDKFNSVRKHVATHRPDSLDWQNSHALQGELSEAVGNLKQTEGPNLLTWGSADVVRQLLAAGLVDELRLAVYPIVLGHGKRLYDGGAQPSSFSLVHSNVAGNGVLLSRYARSGDIRTGSFGA